MSKPGSFILNTDFATLKNDNRGVPVQVTFPGSQFFSGSEEKTVTQDIELGTINASLRCRIASSIDGNKFFAGNSYSGARLGWSDGDPPPPVPYTIVARLVRITPTTLRAIVSVKNPYDGNLATPFDNDTFTFEISTFLSPFVQ